MLTAIPPLSLSAFPVTVYAAPKVIEPNCVSATKLLFVATLPDCPGRPGNIRSSPATGATSPAQFVAVIHLVSAGPAPPSQVLNVDGARRSSSHSTWGRAERLTREDVRQLTGATGTRFSSRRRDDSHMIRGL